MDQGADQSAGEGAAPDPTLAALLSDISQQRLPPVHDWHPERSGVIDIRIARNGDWFYRGSRIERTRMVRLFASVLRADPDGIHLVTPQERLRIVVDDAPFVAVSVERHGAPDEPAFVFLTNLGERVVAGAEHPIRVDYREADGEPSPYVTVRPGLDALIARQAFIELAGFAQVRGELSGIESRGVFMPLGPAA